MASGDEEVRKRARAGVEAMFERCRLLSNMRPEGHKSFDYDVTTNLKLIDATPDGRVEYEFTIPNHFSNLNNVMLGGAAGIIFDVTTTTALGTIARHGFWDYLGGVSRILNVSFLKAVPLGETVKIKSCVIQAGKTMCMIRGEMNSMDGKTTYCTAEHHKVAAPAIPQHAAVRIKWDEEQEELAAQKVAEMKGKL
ncbi:thioesterase family protein-like protein [Lineolata rhizophorae]|uniref:Thioesterase family protein-like protein n=1 Tax=Lineolata rhizophorae TaxID=578093 RepID=A0A6A6NZZ4_9PEZI|nr:thioesterase family protein-like protein [Lineolata rhizophorae]